MLAGGIMKKTSAKLLIVISSIMWGTTGTTQGLLHHANPMSVGALRMLIGGVILFLLSYKNIELKRISKKHILLSSVAMAMYQPLFFYAVKVTGVSIGTLFGLGSAPIFAGLIQLMMKHSLKKQWLVGTIISILGAVLILVTQGEITVHIVGVVMALGAGLSYAIFTFSMAHLVGYQNPNSMNGLIFMLSGVLLSPLLLFNDLSWVGTMTGMVGLLHLGIVTTAIPYTLFAYALRRIQVHEAVTITLIEPLTAAVLGVLILKESMNVAMILGISCILVGLIVTGRS